MNFERFVLMLCTCKTQSYRSDKPDDLAYILPTLPSRDLSLPDSLGIQPCRRSRSNVSPAKTCLIRMFAVTETG